MIRVFLFILCCVSSSSVYSSIFGVDDRLDLINVKDESIQKISRSSVALILKSKMEKLESGNYRLIGRTLLEAKNFCSSERFANQFSNANCSASLVKSDVILTAAHCVDNGKVGIYKLSDYYAVFDYKLSSNEHSDFEVKAENVFELKSFVHYELDKTFSNGARDLTLIRLKRPSGREPLKISFNRHYRRMDEVFTIGYPYGIPMKYANNGHIKSLHPRLSSFRHNLDTFSVNSGSPVFDAASNKIIGVHVRGTGGIRSNSNCTTWPVGLYDKDYGAANTLESILKYFK